MDYAFRNIRRQVVLVAGLWVLFTSLMWAQGGTGELTGLVTDPSGAVLANAQMTLTNVATGDKRTTVTTPAGIYRFVALPVVGNYTLEASPSGFKSVKIANIVISVGTITNQDLKLEVGGATQVVEVAGGAQLLQTSEASVSGLVDRRVWQQMPLETRGQNDFISLFPGAVSGAIAVSSLNNGTDRGAAVNGTRSGTGNYLVEGFSNNDQGLGGAGALVGTGGANTTISPDAIQEYRVIEHNFSAEYGQAGGFVTDTVLKSGTNKWHGSLFEYNRVQALAANSFFSNRNGVKDSLVRNQFGGSIGGPIVKDKSFFYFTTEFHRRRQSTPLTGNVTTPDFLNFVDSGQFETFMETDPNGLCMQLNGTACPGAFANSAHLGPIFKSLASTQPFPLCVPGAANCKNLRFTGGGLWTGGVLGTPGTTYPVAIFGQVTEAQPDKLDQARYTGKFDHRIGSQDQINAAYLYDNADEVQKFGGGDDGAVGFGPSLPSHGRAQNAGITWSHTFSPTVLNQARVAYVRHTANFPGDPKAEAPGIPALATFFDPSVGTFGNASNLPQFFTENEFQYKDDLTVSKGKHNFKGGGEYRRTRNGSSFNSEFLGEFLPYGIEDLVTDMHFGDNADAALAPFRSANSLGAYGSWYFAEASIDPTKTPATRPIYYRGYRASEVAAYLQDDWRIHPRLTLNLGVRWEYFGPPHNFKSGIDSNFYTGAPITPVMCPVVSGGITTQVPCTQRNEFFPNTPFMGAFSTGTLQVKDHDIWNKDLNNWAPRVGFAWDTLGNQKLVIRGGGGVAYDRMYNNIFENIRFNPPFFCFCNFGAFINGVPGGAESTPGIYAVPFTTAQVGLFNSTTLFPNGLPKTSPRAMDQNLVTAYYEQANFGFQYQIGKDMVLESNYVGTFGHKLLGIVNLNTYDGRLAGGTNLTTGGTNATTRPNALVNSINFRTNGFSSNYHAWQTTLRKSFSHGLTFNANYTYSKAMDVVSDTFTPRGNPSFFVPTDSLNPQLDYGPADFDVKHRVVISYTYDLPFFTANRWIGGWSINGIATLQTGVPFSIYDGTFDVNANGTFNDRVNYIGSGTITHALTGSVAAGNADGSGGFINQALFADTVCPASVNQGLWCQGKAVGQSSRNSLYGPNYQNWDLGVGKKFKITESASVQFQANFFNILNRANFALPDADLSHLGSTFGKSQATFNPGQGGARVTQLALRFDF
jgi:Carboxypeptidase regulatory-like domain/TonB dependent receptor